ncbi:hypothetical protein QTG56_23155 (plasmid) [Rossellomorea sp. AcN35-11]|nr:hypothetical protein [Rossellomorea aquimaris]WJV32265.1 hypothetical protein QTG56_23155 [Rossellomorea sp. AcN35-11]
MVAGKARKKRSDAKIEVKPSLELALADVLSYVSDLTGNPIKDVGEAVCKYGLNSKKVTNVLSGYFKRDYILTPTLYRGNPELFTVRTKKRKGVTKRVSIRFRRNDYENLANLAFALDTTVSTAANMLIEIAIKDNDFFTQYLGKYISRELDTEQKAKLRMVLGYINRKNPYIGEVTLFQLILHVMDNMKGNGRYLLNALNEFVDGYFEK